MAANPAALGNARAAALEGEGFIHTALALVVTQIAELTVVIG